MMKARVLLETESMRRWLYVPETHIQVFVMKSGDDKWVVAAYRTDGRIRHGERVMPTTQYLEEACQLVREAEVSEETVAFAVESERLRHTSVDAIADILAKSSITGDLAGGFRDFLALLEHEKLEEEDPEAEERAGEEIHRLLTEKGGLS